MLRTMFPVLCGSIFALAIGMSSSAAGEPGATEPASRSELPEAQLRVCYWACEWFLYESREECEASCLSGCERRCF